MTSQPERVTDEMLNAHIKALGDWTEPFTAERESGVAMDMDISQEDADQFNADERARLRIGYTAALAATPAVSMIITETMIDAGARIHNPFAFDIAGTPMPVHRAQSRNEARQEVHAILSAALAAAPAVGGMTTLPSTVRAIAIDHSDKECPNFPGCHCLNFCTDGWKHPSPEDTALAPGRRRWKMSDDMRNATQGALALYLNEVQPVDGRAQINISLNELNVLRGLAATPAVGGGSRIERAKAIREEQQCSLQEAVRLERAEFLTAEIQSASSIEDLKTVLLSIVNYRHSA